MPHHIRKFFVAHVFNQEQIDDLRDAIKESIEETSWKPIYADDRVISGHILFNKISPDIVEAEFTLFEISNHTRPNVFIELGIAIGLGKPVYLLIRRGIDVPSDLGGMDRIVYGSYKELAFLLRSKLFSQENLLSAPSPKERLLRKYLQHTYYINALAINMDETLLASVSGDQKAIVWNVLTGDIQAVFKHNRWAGNLCFDFKQQKLLTSDGNGFVWVWNLESKSFCIKHPTHEGACRALAISPDEKLIATGGEDNKVNLWSYPDFKLLSSQNAHTAEVRRLAFSPDGQIIASVGEDGKLCIWNLENQSSKIFFESEQNVFRAVSISHRGDFIAITNSNGVVLLWDIKNLVTKWRVQGHEGAVVGLSFHPNDHIVATGGYDNLIRFWDVKSGKLVDTISDHDDAVTCLTFARKGKWLFSGSRDKSIRLWDMSGL